jgi:hypothetical protein
VRKSYLPGIVSTSALHFAWFFNRLNHPFNGKLFSYEECLVARGPGCIRIKGKTISFTWILIYTTVQVGVA